MLGNLLNYMSKFYREEYTFVPKTYLLPKDEEECKREMRDNAGRTWILKPSAGGMGDGIHLVNEYSEVTELMGQDDEYVIQSYVDRPLLFDKKKFDLRIYVILFGVDNMNAYLYEDGLTRFCTVNYEAPNKDNKKNDFMHLTNFSINKKSEEFINGDKQACTQATKRKLSEIYRRIETESPNGHEIVAKIRSEIMNVCRKTVGALHANASKLFVF